MADIGKPRPNVGGPKGPSFDTGSGGGVAVITKPDTKQKTKRKSKTEKEPSWRVLLHNDDVHTFDYVTGAIVKVRTILPRVYENHSLRGYLDCAQAPRGRAAHNLRFFHADRRKL